jgi:hypothetical protein
MQAITIVILLALSATVLALKCNKQIAGGQSTEETCPGTQQCCTKGTADGKTIRLNLFFVDLFNHG